MFYEVREYRTAPGKLRALIGRFKSDTLRLFAKHGFEVVFIGQTELGPHTNTEVLYVLKWDSYAQFEERWAALGGDPEWAEAVRASEADGPIIAQLSRRIVNPTTFVPPVGAL